MSNQRYNRSRSRSRSPSNRRNRPGVGEEDAPRQRRSERNWQDRGKRYQDRHQPNRERGREDWGQRREHRTTWRERNNRPDRNERRGQQEDVPKRDGDVVKDRNDNRQTQDGRRKSEDDRSTQRGSFKEEDSYLRYTDSRLGDENSRNDADAWANGDEEEGGRGRFRGRRNSRTDERMKQVVINPMEVPKGNKYFTHDDREGRGSSRGGVGFRKPKLITPRKWGHDMFDKMVSGESATPPAEEDKQTDESQTRAVDEEGRDPLDLPQETFQELDLYPEAEV